MKYAENTPEHIVKCPGTRKIDGCNWHGDIKECKRVRDLERLSWFVYWSCPVCGSKVAEISSYTPLNHPLQPFARMQHHGGYLVNS